MSPEALEKAFEIYPDVIFNGFFSGIDLI